MKGQVDRVEFTEAEQLKNYETHARVFEQVSGFLTYCSTVTQLYVTITGALWFALGTSSIHLERSARLAAILIHVVASISVLITLVLVAATMKQRTKFLRDMGRKYWSTIQDLGNGAGQAVVGPSTQENGENTREEKKKKTGSKSYLNVLPYAWIIAPVVGGVGSVILGASSLTDAGHGAEARQACASAAALLLTHQDRQSVEAAQFMFNKLGCPADALMTQPAKPDLSAPTTPGSPALP